MHAFLTASSNSKFVFLGGSIPGKRSFNKPKNITSSEATIFGVLKSRRARNRIAYKINKHCKNNIRD